MYSIQIRRNYDMPAVIILIKLNENTNDIFRRLCNETLIQRLWVLKTNNSTSKFAWTYQMKHALEIEILF